MEVYRIQAATRKEINSIQSIQTNTSAHFNSIIVQKPLNLCKRQQDTIQAQKRIGETPEMSRSDEGCEME